jgi:hypothetical protein
VQRTSALFSAHADYADVTPTQYAAALDWLRDRDLLAQPPPRAGARDAVLDAALTDSLWFRDFDTLVTAPEDMPEDALRAGALLSLGPADTFARARHLFGQVDTEARKHFGSIGELALVSLLEAVPGAAVNHLAAESDGYGYDILLTLEGLETHLEVKTTNRRHRLTLYLSRHEYETLRRDPLWALAAVLLDSDLRVKAVATVDREWLAAAAPADQTMSARWETVKVDVPGASLAPGLDLVAGRHLPPGLAVLVGDPPWRP